MNSGELRWVVGLCIALAADPASAQATTPSGQQSAATADQDASTPGNGGINLGKHDTNAPINVTSDDFVGDLNTKVGTYIGNVVVIQADYRLKADKVKIETEKGNPSKFFADGNVVFVSTSGSATGDNGVYDLTPPRTLTLTGKKVVLTKEKDVMRGTRLVVNLVTGDSHLTAQGMPGNRVQTYFIPKQQNPKAKPTQTPQK
jgi:lipopolysaccharide export system protein LptA